MTGRRGFVLGALGLPASHWLIASGRAEAAELGDAAIIAPTGRLRAAFLEGNPAQAVRDPTSGTWSGVAIDLVAELARSLGTPQEMVGMPSVQAVLAALESGAVDIGFLGNDPTRRVTAAFTQPYLLNPQSIIVPPAARLRSFSDLEGAPMRIGVTKGDSIALHIARTFPLVTLVEIEQNGVAEAKALLESGTVDGFAANRLRLQRIREQSPTAVILPGSLYGVPQAIVVKQDRPRAREAVDRFLDRVKADGFLAASIARAANGTEIEPPRSR